MKCVLGASQCVRHWLQEENKINVVSVLTELTAELEKQLKEQQCPVSTKREYGASDSFRVGGSLLRGSNVNLNLKG